MNLKQFERGKYGKKLDQKGSPIWEIEREAYGVFVHVETGKYYQVGPFLEDSALASAVALDNAFAEVCDALLDPKEKAKKRQSLLWLSALRYKGRFSKVPNVPVLPRFPYSLEDLEIKYGSTSDIKKQSVSVKQNPKGYKLRVRGSVDTNMLNLPQLPKDGEWRVFDMGTNNQVTKIGHIAALRGKEWEIV